HGVPAGTAARLAGGPLPRRPAGADVAGVRGGDLRPGGRRPGGRRRAGRRRAVRRPVGAGGTAGSRRSRAAPGGGGVLPGRLGGASPVRRVRRAGGRGGRVRRPACDAGAVPGRLPARTRPASEAVPGGPAARHLVGRTRMDDVKERIAAQLTAVRERSLTYTAADDDVLTAQHSRLMSPLVWDLAHVGNY